MILLRFPQLSKICADVHQLCLMTGKQSACYFYYYYYCLLQARFVLMCNSGKGGLTLTMSSLKPLGLLTLPQSSAPSSWTQTSLIGKHHAPWLTSLIGKHYALFLNPKLKHRLHLCCECLLFHHF
jgi:hypothetical protein